ncbi:MAG: radical SAM family heme chaperone HemW [Planctomycetota bacterium]|jgi:oxygen-independent coproporphyrinogen-3 oxidase|nr:radical SAM family heme chaperone HemW [Planctomycetota bacterium]MDP7251453.1 radical SAM family heme chaperone HemW [Planctomycetota bacterium]
MPHGAYLHIPFCLSKCSYCDFFSVIGEEESVPAYTESICKEIAMYADRELVVDTIFFGGGTPSYIPAAELGRMLETLVDCFAIANDTEVTCETNPETVDPAKLDELRSIGINRLSLGVQSFHDHELQQIGRAHDAARAVRCFREAREAGFTNVSMDLISALPEMSLQSWKDSLERLVELEPDHLSAYTLEYHPGTKFERERTLGLLNPSQEFLEREMYLETISFLEGHGHGHYEISNFARPGFECRHNLKYWRHEPYLAFGASAHGFDGRRRYWNHRHLKRYLEDIGRGLIPVVESEELNESQIRLEELMLGLRMREGAVWDGDLPSEVPAELCGREGGRVSLTANGFVLYESVCAAFARKL